jgi:hypothetical protein
MAWREDDSAAVAGAIGFTHTDLRGFMRTSAAAAAFVFRSQPDSDAVDAAVADTRDRWETLKEQLVMTCGPSRGMRMVCALTRDNPRKSC